jgi:hypothetical protein
MTGPDAKLGDKISLAEGARKRRVGKALSLYYTLLNVIQLDLLYYSDIITKPGNFR